MSHAAVVLGFCRTKENLVLHDERAQRICLFWVLLLLCYRFIDIGSMGSKQLPFLLQFLLGILRQYFSVTYKGPVRKPSHKELLRSEKCCICSCFTARRTKAWRSNVSGIRLQRAKSPVSCPIYLDKNFQVWIWKLES